MHISSGEVFAYLFWLLNQLGWRNVLCRWIIIVIYCNYVEIKVIQPLCGYHSCKLIANFSPIVPVWKMKYYKESGKQSYFDNQGLCIENEELGQIL